MDTLSRLVADLRPEDIREMQTVGAGDLTERLQLAALRADDAFYVTDGAHPLALFGVGASPVSGWGAVWMVATRRSTVRRWRVAKAGRAARDAWAPTYPEGLHCLVDSRNTMHLRWLEFLEFSRSPSPVPINGVPFYLMSYTVPSPPIGL